MLHAISKLLAKPTVLLTALGVLFLIVNLRMLAMLLPDTDMLIKFSELTSVKKEAPQKRDWHDYRVIYHDARRFGIGEQGQPAKLSSNVDRKLEQRLTKEYGYNAMLSDKISVFRSIPDRREENCSNKEYLSNLSAVSIVIPFRNEYFSVLLRTLHSLINRTPRELLQEIILVDDFSDREFLYKQLDEYVARYFDKIQIIRLPERSGLVYARSVGALKATAEVLVFLNSHVEVNHNWLPPLLEPIVLDKRNVVCPLIDRINNTTFEYQFAEGERGGFDWTFRYVQLELLPDDMLDRTKPYRTPVMNGHLFAINTDYFFELGAYDEGLNAWGGEQYELSFKIWLCGGQLLNAPCSRIGHLYRNVDPEETTYNLFKNYKRIAEVWMDEYKNYIYERQKSHYDAIDEGDLTVQKAIRSNLKCQSFKWYMEEIAFDFLKLYPPIEPSEYAWGAIKSIGSPNLCVDTLDRKVHERVGLQNCSKSLSNPVDNQRFALNWRRELRKRNTYICLDVPEYRMNAFVLLETCHNKDDDSQLWFYDRTKKLLKYGKTGNYCLEAAPATQELYVNICQSDNLNMQWKFGIANKTALDSMFII